MATTKAPVTLRPIIVDTPPFTVNVPGYAPAEGESVPRRNADYADRLLAEPEEGVATIFDIVTRGARKFGHANALGSRSLIKTHSETKKVTKIVDGVEQQVDKKWTYFELSEYKYLSFVEYEEQILQLGAGLRNLGLQKDDRLFIFAATSAPWLAMAHGAASQSMPIVTAYDTLGEEAIRQSLAATKPKIVFFDPALIGTLSNTLKDNKNVKTVVYNDQHVMKPEYINELQKSHEGLQILSFNDLRKLGKENMVEPIPPKSDDICCIMYTSGSMGAPKGVMLKHKNIIGAVSGITAVVGPFVGPSDAVIAYLPLAHIFEFVVENASLFWGSELGYGTAKTLSDGSMKNCKGDIREFRPTIMVGVPTVWEGIRKGIVAKVEKQGMLAKTAFWAALAMKSWMCKYKLPGSDMFDNMIFGKVRDATGGRMRACANGAGPISQDTQNFISMVVAPMISGYGMTESSGMGALGNPNRWTSRAIGDIPACVEIKLVDFPEAKYFSSASPPQGEIWVRGTSVMEGYYQNDKETAEVMTPDGWLKTGDIGEWDSNGHLRIIDRKKNLVKTMNGEYIALEKLESIYRTSPIVSNICVYASISHQKPIALIVLAEPAAKALAAANGISCTEGLTELITNERFQDLTLKEVHMAGKLGGLVGIEIVSGVVLVAEEWTPQNGLLTSAMKLCRRPIVEKYKNDIDMAYAKNS